MDSVKRVVDLRCISGALVPFLEEEMSSHCKTYLDSFSPESDDSIFQPSLEKMHSHWKTYLHILHTRSKTAAKAVTFKKYQ